MGEHIYHHRAINGLKNFLLVECGILMIGFINIYLCALHYYKIFYKKLQNFLILTRNNYTI